jgi:hypothetical protein
LQTARWLKGRQVIAVADSSFSVIELLRDVKDKRDFRKSDQDLTSVGFQFQGRRSAILLAGWPLTMRSSTLLM